MCGNVLSYKQAVSNETCSTLFFQTDSWSADSWIPVRADEHVRLCLFLHSKLECTHINSQLSCHGDGDALTWYLGCELGDDGRSVAFDRAGSDSEGVCGTRIQTHKHMRRLITELQHLPALIGQIKLRVKWAHSLIEDLQVKENKHMMSWATIIQYCVLNSTCY